MPEPDEGREREECVDRLEEQLLERLTVGGFEWELVGLAWFVLGVVAAAWVPSL